MSLSPVSERLIIITPGKFYWVLPVFDVDFTPPGFEGQGWSEAMHDAAWRHWSQQKQPALFLGLTEAGTEKWVYLGQEVGSAHPDPWWPVCWIGDEIS